MVSVEKVLSAASSEGCEEFSLSSGLGDELSACFILWLTSTSGFGFFFFMPFTLFSPDVLYRASPVECWLYWAEGVDPLELGDTFHPQDAAQN